MKSFVNLVVHSKGSPSDSYWLVYEDDLAWLHEKVIQKGTPEYNLFFNQRNGMVLQEVENKNRLLFHPYPFVTQHDTQYQLVFCEHYLHESDINKAREKDSSRVTSGK